MTPPNGVQLDADIASDSELAALVEEVLTEDALSFLANLHRQFDSRRRQLLAARAEQQAALEAGASLDFLTGTKDVRDDKTWQVADPAPGLEDRRVEITGPADQKMTVNALNSGAKVWLADFEDANTPLLGNMLSGQRNLRRAITRSIDFETAGRQYALGHQVATIVVRPRGWHLPEKHLLVDGEPMSGSLFDFGLYLFHCGQLQIDSGSGPYFYLPKMESYLEARLWNDVFVAGQDAMGIAQGTVRATCLIETYPAAFQMEEILYELRDHSAGLNAGRWDYLFSVIKTFRGAGREYLLPDRNAVTMTAPFMRAYTELLVTTCHRRGAHAIGGMAAFIPNRMDPEANDVALAKVRADKTREADDGFDGSWVAHPDLVPVCREVFDAVLGEASNQRDRRREAVDITATQLLDVKSTPGEITASGLRNNVSVGLQYLEAWLRGSGAVAIFGLMEDAATAEISRTQVWQWQNLRVELADGETVTKQLVERVIDEELARIRHAAGEEAFVQGRWSEATTLYRDLATSAELADFLTLRAYAQMP
jgi:malate synthase